MADFSVVVRLATGTPQLWIRVLKTSVSELPPLTAEQRATAKRWGITAEDYQRSLLLQTLSEERFQEQGIELGKAAQHVLAGLDAPGTPYKLRAVIIEAHKDRWSLRVETPAGVVEIPVGAELRERIFANGDASAQEALKCELLPRLGRTDLIAKR